MNKKHYSDFNKFSAKILTAYLQSKKYLIMQSISAFIAYSSWVTVTHNERELITQFALKRHYIKLNTTIKTLIAYDDSHVAGK